MLIKDTDREWEKFGTQDPYFGVLADEKFRTRRLTDAGREEFFQSGRNHIQEVLKKVKEHVDPVFTVRRALDFGCGVGRLVIPLSEVSEEVVGADVSPAMLAEAGRNCRSRSITNVELRRTDDDLSALPDDFNFIHSFIVFQHIPVKRGERIFASLLSRLADGGVGVVHFPYAKMPDVNWFRALIALAKRYVPLARNFIHLIRGRSFFTPYMQMNHYDLNRLFFIMQAHNVHRVVTEYIVDGRFLGVILYFQKGNTA
ncbi:MAG: hypothetical protein A2X58_05825 [Nitrospirae bacterium GWC2_56_14]|nr:MAG: hypothetical protein A2X58_05825 [Nitrospirae bacterium GWC2_56_14]